MSRERRFICASTGAILFVAILGLVGMAAPLLTFFVYLAFVGGMHLVFETWNGLPDANHYGHLLETLFLPATFVGLIVGMVAGTKLWDRFFVRNGYLDRHTLDCMKENLAPTPRLERIRKAIGFAFLIPFFIWLNWGVYQKPVKDWWLFLVTLPLLLYFLRLALKEYGSAKQ